MSLAKQSIECIQNYARHLKRLLKKDIWELDHLRRRTVRARVYYLLRVLTLTGQGLKRNQLPMQSAALTFYSSIGIGPLVAFGIMISGFLLDRDISETGAGAQESIVVQKITEIIAFAAPQVAVSVGTTDGETSHSELAPELLELITNFSNVAQSGTVGVIGIFVLLFICLRVLTSIETSFNTLWGVSKGRNLTDRVFTYWTFISLGAVLGTATISLQVLNTFLRFTQTLPFGATLSTAIQFFVPVLMFAMIVLLIAAFLRFMPNTKVEWRPALVGATVVVALLKVYEMVSFLYVQQVVSNKSLYGSVGIIVILMLGLYVFWLLLLLGGQITYAVQNADFLTNENAWEKTSERSRELISLSILLIALERFYSGQEAVRTSELLQKIRVPSHILNSSIQRLCSIGYLNQVESSRVDEQRDHSYQPSRPAESITLGDFKHSIETFGNDEGSELVSSSNPAIRKYVDKVLPLKDCADANINLAELIRCKQ